MIFITLNTGHTMLVKPEHIFPETIDAIMPLIRAGGGAVPGFSDYRFSIHDDEDNPDLLVFSISRGDDFICTDFVCNGSYEHAWNRRILPFCEAAGIKPVPVLVEEPFLAAAVLPGSILFPEALSWIGDFEKCVGWIILKYFGDQK